jgi:uncharacterized protein YjbJ (UPF0337 family)
MGTVDKTKNRGEIAKGEVKEAKADQVAGNIKQAGEKVKDAARDMIR